MKKKKIENEPLDALDNLILLAIGPKGATHKTIQLRAFLLAKLLKVKRE